MALTEAEINKRVSESYEVENNVLEAVPNPLVSIRTSTYNHGPYIKQCIEGILMQKTNFAFEYIIGEDFSTDETREIVFDYAKRYPNIIRVITADYNVGSKANGRRCINACRGKYMAICEGDDYWIDPLKLQKQVDFLENNPDYYIIGMRSLIYYQDVGKVRFYDYSLHLSTSFKSRAFVYNILMHTSTFLFRREYISSNASLQANILQGDIFNVLHSSNHGLLKIKVLKDFGSIYRLHTGGITRTKEHTNVERSFNSMRMILESYDAYSYLRDHRVVIYKIRRDFFLMRFRELKKTKRIYFLIRNIDLVLHIVLLFMLRKIEVGLVKIWNYRVLNKL